MMTSRRIEASDEQLLRESLERDSYHAGTTPEFFYADGSVCNVYEDDKGPVLFLRGAKALRLDIQFVDNNDFERNRQIMLQGFPGFVEKAKAAGFSELIFYSNSPLLIRFCKQQFGFREVDGELRLLVQKDDNASQPQGGQ